MIGAQNSDTNSNTNNKSLRKASPEAIALLMANKKKVDLMAQSAAS